jgi:hypothetical protein
MTTDGRVPVGSILLAALLAAGLWLRLGQPSFPPFNEAESGHAVRAALEAPVPPPLASLAALGPPTNASYHAITVVLFQWFGSGNLVARLVPIAAGVLLLLLPLLVQHRQGRQETLMAIAMLAVSPAIVTISRSPGGPTLALLGVAFAGMSLMEGWDRHSPPTWLARAWPIGIGVAVCSGPFGWTGLLVLLLAAAARLLQRKRASGDWELPILDRPALLAALALGLLLSTGFGLAPSGLQAVASGLGGWLQGWARGGALAPLPFVLALLVFEPLATFLGISRAVRTAREPEQGERWLLTWALAGLVVPLLYPAREAGDLVWSVLPFTLLAAQAASDLAAPAEDSATATSRTAMVAVLLMLGAFAYLQISSYLLGLSPRFDPLGNPSLSLLFGVLATGLGIVMLFLFALGWSRSAAVQAGHQAACLLLLLAVLGAVWRLNFGGPSLHAGDLWRSEAASPQQVQLRQTLEMVAGPTRRSADPITMLAEGSLPASLVWTLRDVPITPAVGYQIQGSPAVLLTPEQGTLPLPSDYVGQTFSLSEKRAWGILSPSEAVRWWLRGTGPTTQERWIVLIRSDLASPDTIPLGNP